MTTTSIEWTDLSWPLANGCRSAGPGCENCYAARLSATRLSKTKKYSGLAVMKKSGPQWTGETRFWEADLLMPVKRQKPAKIFVADMGDLFYEGFTDEQIASVWAVMLLTPRHTYQVLTKRAGRMRELLSSERFYDLVLRAADAIRVRRPALTQVGISNPSKWPAKWIWLGVSVENQAAADERVQHLLDTPAAVRFISAEPLLSPIDLRHVQQDDVYSIDALTGDVREGTGANGTGFRVDRGCVAKLDWVIVGGESGPGARPCEVEWIRGLVEQCKDTGTKCFVKQLGAKPLTFDTVQNVAGEVVQEPVLLRVLDKKGGDIRSFPEDLRVREWPRGGGDE